MKRRCIANLYVWWVYTSGDDRRDLSSRLDCHFTFSRNRPQIAFDLGFIDSSQLQRNFRERFGLTPREVRQQGFSA